MDRTALERELEALHAQSFAWALACCGNRRHEAEDALQVAYLRVLDGSACFAGRSAFRTWLFGVIRRTSAEQRRRRLWFGAVRNGGPPIDAVDPRPRADARLEQDQRAGELQAALGALPRRQREVLELVFYHDMTIADAAQVMGVSLGTARTHYERGKKNLANRLGPQR
jgi:RNA polymerase sigma-70 factor (ECF subfamily)